MLEEIIPFRYLSPAERESLRADVDEVVFEPNAVLIEKDAVSREVFLILEGSVRVIDPDDPRPGQSQTVVSGNYIGERAALFDEPRALEVRAVDRVRALVIPGDRFLTLIHESTPFAQALGNILRDKQGIFRPFDRFLVALLDTSAGGSVDLQTLLPHYERLRPALHAGVSDSHEVDAGALSYAIRRLPENLTGTLAYYVTDTLPALFAAPARHFDPVPTAARRRAVYEMMPGKSMVLVRDGISDLLDFICCLCLFAIEARKLRRRIKDEGGLDAVPEDVLLALADVWPEDAREKLRTVALHHEDFRIEVHKERDNYNNAHSETWCAQIADATRQLIGMDPSDLPAEFGVHVISSNTHSVPNCLSPWMGRHACAIVDWAREIDHPATRGQWHNEHDLAYAVARDYLHAYPDAVAERAAAERDAGLLTVDGTSFTGIAVQLIDPSRVAWGDTDPGIPNEAPAQPGLIVNIDYAFGEQAEHIVANLVSLFGRNLRSVNVLGKAGGLMGERGDVLVATGFVEQRHDRFHAIPGAQSINIDRLRSELPDRGVHVGNVLTVTGTLLQNRTMLHFNRHIWRCVGLEMEGSFYLRHVVQSMHRGSVPGDVIFRFLYYTSDLPLDHASNLSARLRSVEGVPPLYATTREVLRGILKG